MAATTGASGIIYTTLNSAVFTEDLVLDLYAGTPVDDTNWLDGNAGGSYPGTLAGFNAANTDGNAVKGLN